MHNKNIFKIIFILILIFSFSSCENNSKIDEKKEIIIEKTSENSSDKVVEIKNKVIEKKSEFTESDFENFGQNEKTEEKNQDSENNEDSENSEEKKTEVVEKLSCEDQYNELLNKFKGDFSDCKFKKEDIGTCNGEKSETGKINLVIVFDDSGSMGAKIGNKTMIDIAKRSVNKYIRKIDLNDTNLGFVLYGHRGAVGRKLKKLSCYGVEEVMSLGNKSKSQTLNRIEELHANGWTPIDRSLKKAKDMINSYAKPKDKNIILLISDGKESCGGNPIETAKNISDGKNQIKIDVIGFNVEGDDKNELLKISNNGGGKYFDVKNELEFEKTFNNVKTFLKKMECGANKAAQELEQGVKAINTFYTCQYKMKEEEALIYTSMNEECEDYIEDKLEIRQKLLENDFEDLKDEGEDILNNFSDNMTNIKRSIK